MGSDRAHLFAVLVAVYAASVGTGVLAQAPPRPRILVMPFDNGTFTGLSMKIAGAYILKATDGALKAATSKPITIAAAAAAKLVITQQPLTGKAAITLSPALIVKVEDIFGNVAIANTSTITLAISSAPVGAKLAGTLSVKAIKGVASFGNLSLQKRGSYVLKATDGLLTAAVSKTIAIS